jgi:hypothetical protein
MQKPLQSHRVKDQKTEAAGPDRKAIPTAADDLASLAAPPPTPDSFARVARKFDGVQPGTEVTFSVTLVLVA